MHPLRHVPTVAVPLRTLAFWTAVLLPFVYLPMALDGFAGGSRLRPFVALVAVHAVALSLGHDHDP